MFHVAVGNLKKGCRLLRFHFNCCRYFLGHVACCRCPLRNLSIRGAGLVINGDNQFSAFLGFLSLMPIGLIHDSRHVGFEIVMQISHVLYWGANIGKRANCGKSARRNIEITSLLKVHFSI